MPTWRAMLRSALLLATVTAAPLAAQATDDPAPTGLGFALKGGIGFDPEQFVVGAQVSLGKTLGFVRVVPNAHLGFGDATTFDMNADFLLRLVVEDQGFGFYGGVAPGWITYDGGSDFGLSGVVGTQVPLLANRATNLEVRWGFTDRMPDLRILATLVF